MTMKITNGSNYRRKIGGTWIEPGETEEVDADISEDELSYYFKLEDDSTSTAETAEVEEAEDESVDEDDEEVSKSEENENNKGD